MYDDIPEALRHLIEPIVRDHGLDLVDAPVHKGRGATRLQVIVDTQSGDGKVEIEQCARVAREVSHALDATDALHGTYELEVGSPGVDRELARPIDFERAVGRRVAIETRRPLSGQRRFKGELIAFDRERAQITSSVGPAEIPFAEIARAKSFYPFETGGTRG